MNEEQLRNYNEQVAHAAKQYLQDKAELESAQRMAEHAALRIRSAEARIAAARAVLEQSVQPIAGSATKPNRRVYLSEDHTLALVVVYDHETGGRGGPRITVERVG